MNKSQIEEILQQELQPSQLEVVDESHLHAGHAGAIESGGGHFKVFIVSEAFAGKTLIQRHRLIYAALEAQMGAKIHALAITAKTSQEVS